MTTTMKMNELLEMSSSSELYLVYELDLHCFVASFYVE